MKTGMTIDAIGRIANPIANGQSPSKSTIINPNLQSPIGNP
jgi:hypothetical protein